MSQRWSYHSRLVVLLCCFLVPVANGAAAVQSGGRVDPPQKYHPGHYVSLNKNDARADISALRQPGIVGVQKRYRWADLEPTKDHYDFSVIKQDLEQLAALNLQLVVFIEDKTFENVRPTPEYLQAYTLSSRKGGYIAKRWDPYVVERLDKLMQALGEEFDAHPNLEGIAIQETSMGVSEGDRREHGYSPERYRDALIEILIDTRKHFPHSQVFWYMNFLEDGQRYIADVARAVAPYHIAMGGPDILPDNRALQKHVYPFYQEFKDKMVLFCSMQHNSFAHRNQRGKGKYWTLEELFDYARDELHVQYVFWNRKNWKKPADSYDWSDALPVIKNNPVFNTGNTAQK